MTLTGRLSERFGGGVVLAAGLCLIGVSALLQPLSTGAPMTIALMCGIAIGQCFALPNVGALISRSVDAQRQGQILGLNNAAAALARITGPFCAALGYSHLTIHAPFLQAAAVAVPAVWLALAAAREAPPMERHEPAVAERPIRACAQE
jgi:MFS family permease